MRLARRIAVCATDALFACALVALAVTAATQEAQAYVDPSVMTYTIQALAGVAVALSAVLGVVWRRVRKHLLRALRIDENANKELEPAVHAVAADDPAREELLAQARADAEQAHRELGTVRPERLCWGTRLVFALVASVLLAFTVLVVAPLEIVAGSSASLQFTVSDVWIPLSVTALALSTLLALALSNLRGRVFDVAFALVLALAVCCYVQAVFLNEGLPIADGNEVAWDSYTKITVFSALVWAVILAASAALAWKRSLTSKGVGTAVALLLMLAQAVGLGATFASPASAAGVSRAGTPTMTKRGMLDVSSNQNVVMFILDTFDTKGMNSLLESHPELHSQLAGFTYYPDSVGSMIPTRYGVPSLVAGKTLVNYNKGTFGRDDIRKVMGDPNLMDDMKALGWSTGAYSADLTPYLSALQNKADNVRALDRMDVDWKGSVAELGKAALYRDLPWALKPAFRFYTDDMNSGVIPRTGELNSSVYTLDDPRFNEILAKQGLTENEMPGDDKGAYRIIHLQGSHGPYTMDETGLYRSEGTDWERQTLGALHIVDTYLSDLKELGVYDKTTVIITADHGDWYLTADDITEPTTPVLLVKPANQSSDDAGKELAVSETPTGHLDIPGTILEAAGGDASTYGTTVFDAPQSGRVRSYFETLSDGADDTVVRQWDIMGNVLDWNSWQRVDQEWTVTKEE